MRVTDFKKYGVTKFTPEEVTATGARLSDVAAIQMVALQSFRVIVDRRVVLLPGGMTSGKHASEEHPMGLAADVAFYEQDGPISFKKIYRAALDSRFTGIGIYHNGAAYSMHLGLRPRHVHWVAWKKHRDKDWNFEYDFMVDPALFAEGIVDPKPLRS